MDLRNPVQSLTIALMRALERDLDGVESALATDLLRTQSGKPVMRRPHERECSVTLFTQSWTWRELGHADDGDVETETVVITGPNGDACVYAGLQLLYHVGSPNRRFFLDVAAQRMRAKAAGHEYEGRDSADEEAFDYEVAATLARVCGALRHLDGRDAERVAKRLRRCVDDVQRCGAGAARH